MQTANFQAPTTKDDTKERDEKKVEQQQKWDKCLLIHAVELGDCIAAIEGCTRIEAVARFGYPVNLALLHIEALVLDDSLDWSDLSLKHTIRLAGWGERFCRRARPCMRSRKMAASGAFHPCSSTLDFRHQGRAENRRSGGRR